MCSVPCQAQGVTLPWPGQGWALKRWVSWEGQARERPTAKRGRLDKWQWRADTKGAWRRRTGELRRWCLHLVLKNGSAWTSGAVRRGVLWRVMGARVVSPWFEEFLLLLHCWSLHAHVSVLSQCLLCSLISTFLSIVVFCRPRLILDQSVWLFLLHGWLSEPFIFFIFYFYFLTSLLEYNCFTMVCSFLLYNKVNHIHIHTHTHTRSHISSLLRLPPSLSHSSRWSQSTELILCYEAASH